MSNCALNPRRLGTIWLKPMAASCVAGRTALAGHEAGRTIDKERRRRIFTFSRPLLSFKPFEEQRDDDKNCRARDTTEILQL